MIDPKRRPIACWMIMKQPSSRRTPGTRWASACSCCFTSAGTSTPCATSASVTSAEPAPRTSVVNLSSRVRYRA